MGHYLGLNGTFGLAVQDRLGDAYALTCAHVVAPHWLQPKGHEVESPADADGAAGPNVMGVVADWTVFDGAGVNTVDAALVRPRAKVKLSNAKLGLGATPRFSSLKLADLAKMRAHPIRIQSQRGTVHGVLDSLQNDLAFHFHGRYFRFSNVMAYTAQMLPGDSGSVVCDDVSRDVLGLHFAGSSPEGMGFGIPSITILKAFESYGLTIAVPA